jgi:hypothetical protein
MIGALHRTPKMLTLVSTWVTSLSMRGRKRSRRHAAMLSAAVISSSAPAAANA